MDLGNGSMAKEYIQNNCIIKYSKEDILKLKNAPDSQKELPLPDWFRLLMAPKQNGSPIQSPPEYYPTQQVRIKQNINIF